MFGTQTKLIREYGGTARRQLRVMALAGLKWIPVYSGERVLGVAYKTAWYLCHRVREAVKDADTTLLGLDSGFVECDEAFIGGKVKWMHAADRAKLVEDGKLGRRGKKVVFGAIERGGKVRLQSGGLHSVKKELLREFLNAKLADETKVISTDEHGG